MVVSDMGEQWSPHTAPAIHALIAMIIIVGSVSTKRFTTMGISIPKVPHEVPVANERNTATRKTMKGRMKR